jgi:N-acetylglucosamine-6-phosphate deacetylase
MTTEGWIIRGGKLFTPQRVIPEGYLVVEGDRLGMLGGRAEDIPPDYPVFDASSCWVTPGLIDLHLHGAMGHSALGSGLGSVARELVRHGITSFLPTLLTTDQAAALQSLEETARAIAAEPTGASPLGIHLEGPQLSPRKRGMAAGRDVHPLTAQSWHGLQAAARGTIRMMTFAPEEGPDFSLIPRLLEEGVIPSIGHSVASFEQVSEMVDLGLRHASHMFNAMGPFHHRDPGVVGAVLLHREIVTQLIADLHHVHPGAIQLLLRLKGAAHVALVSDAAPVAGLPPGQYPWDDQTQVIIHEDGTCRLPDGTLAGATSFLDRGVANLARVVGLNWPQALLTATAVPGEVLGLKRGRLRPGWIADVVIWDRTFQPVATMVEGRWVWEREQDGRGKG